MKKIHINISEVVMALFSVVAILAVLMLSVMMSVDNSNENGDFKLSISQAQMTIAKAKRITLLNNNATWYMYGYIDCKREVEPVREVNKIIEGKRILK